MGKTGALILAAGRGTRMGSEIPKQFMPLCGKPLLLYSVETYLPTVDRVIVVTGEAEIGMTRTLLSENGFDGIDVIPGGKERYDSSYAGIRFLSELGGFDTVLIHDAARPFTDADTIRRVTADSETYGAAVASVLSTNTVKISDPEGFVMSTPDRKTCRIIQTPQGFSLPLIRSAYEKLFERGTDELNVTDDAMVAEMFGNVRVKLSEGSEDNFKVTTPSDLIRAEAMLRARSDR